MRYKKIFVISVFLGSGIRAQSTSALDFEFNDDEISISSISVLSKIKVMYNFPDLLNPKLIHNASDTVSLSNFVRRTDQNASRINRTQDDFDAYEHRQIIVEFQSVIQTSKHLVGLTERVYGKDILLWRQNGMRFSLVGIYPSQVGVCLYCNPDFYTTTLDTFSIGTVNEEEGDIYGGYKFYTISSDTLRLVKQLSISGSGNGNPVAGATTIGYLTTFYGLNGAIADQSIHYSSVYENQDTVYAHAINDSISLFELRWREKGNFIQQVFVGSQKFKVGISKNYGGTIFTAIEYADEWYLGLRDDISF